MNHVKLASGSWCVAVAVLILLAFTGSAQAENLGPGGGTRVITGEEVVGPFRLLITSSPEPAQVGQVTYAVRVSDASTGDRIRDAEIEVELVNPANGTTLRDAVTHEKAGNAVDYAAHVLIEAAGTYEGVIRVRAAAGNAEVKFLQRIAPKRTAMTVIAVGLPFLVLLTVLGGLWFVRSGSRRQRAE